jgi:signal transduction histidine kinase
MAEKSREYGQNFNLGKKDNTENVIHILLIEDNLGDIRLIQEMIKDLENTTIRLIVQKDLSTGIQYLNQHKFHLILLDLSLPDSHGIDTIERILKRVDEIPIIVLTGTDNLMLAIEAVKSGAQDYLIKGNINRMLLERSIYYSIERHKIMEKLKKSEEKFHQAFLRADFYKDIFTHDMSNILQGIISGVEICNLNEFRLNDKRDLEEAAEIIERHVTRGAKLISNIRKLSRLEDSSIPTQSMELCKPLKKSIINLKNTYHRRTIEIKIDAHDRKFFVHANSLLQDIFENILANAVRHNLNSRVEIVIRISHETSDKNYTKLEFLDNGIGIENSRKKAIFLRGSKQDYGLTGMGLGLSLVTKIIKNMDGKIWIEDRVDGDHSKGSNFILLIPEVM